MPAPLMQTKTDVLVVGGGAAGARAALEAAAAGAKVIMLSKGPIARSGVTPLAEGSITAAMGSRDPLDSPVAHAEDLLREGRSLADYSLLKTLTEDASACIEDLLSYGMNFSKKNSSLVQHYSPGDTYPRTLNIKGKGFAMMRTLHATLKKSPLCRIFEDVIVTKLFCLDGSVRGALALSMQSGELSLIEAKSTIIATGGNLQLWPHSDTPVECSGDGQALAFSAGAELVDMEMVLYYPMAALAPESAKGTIISYEHFLDPELCGGRLLNRFGEEFLPTGKPPVRDVLVRLIFNEINNGRGTENGGILLDVTASETVKEKARQLVDTHLVELNRHLLKVGVNLLEKPLEVAPATHYTLGGIRIDPDGRTTVEGLFAAGEAAGNVHGANRIAGNALTETQVFGKRAGQAAAQRAKMMKDKKPNDRQALQLALNREAERINAFLTNGENSDLPSPIELKAKLQMIMGDKVGLPRSADGLKQSLLDIETLKIEFDRGVRVSPEKKYNLSLVEALELPFMLLNAELIVRSALLRKESRGHHQRSDYPATDNTNWLRHTAIKLAENGAIATGTIPVEIRP